MVLRHIALLNVLLRNNNSTLFARYLADLMDNGELIRNVALAGHLHHGKVRMFQR